MKQLLAFLFVLVVCNLSAQNPSDEDALFIRKIYETALTRGKAYDWLVHLTTKIGGRLSGSTGAQKAVDYTQSMLDTMALDRVWRQPCEVTHWERGAPEEVLIVGSPSLGTIPLKALALGNSTATPDAGITAEVIEVFSLEEVNRLGPAAIKGKIVFFNRPMDPTAINTFQAYGGASDQRGAGPVIAARNGAVGVLVRSLTLSQDDHPHTGSTMFGDTLTTVPAVGISTNDANRLSALLKKEKVQVFLRTHCKMFGKAPSFNVIGEIRGSEHPEEIILVGGHLDSWDPSQGAHDDGAGCVHAMDALYVLKKLGYQPKRTLRCVLFMNEENGLYGGRTYADSSNLRNEFHLAAIESDAGGFTPRGFTMEGDESHFTDYLRSVQAWSGLLEPYDLFLAKGGSGADIGPLRSQKGLLIGFRPDSQRYFDFHHTAIDNIEAVNPRELQMGVGAIASLIYLIDKYGL